MQSLVNEIADQHRSGKEVVLVTSGAIGAGMQALGMRQRPAALPDLQMAAAVGQTRLMSRYSELFGEKNCTVGQILMTHDDFQNRLRIANAKRTIENLLKHRVIPIINENDVVADEEIRADIALGDNDLLATLVSKMVRADLLMLLTTVDGVREHGRNGRSRRISYIEDITRKTMALVQPDANHLSKGGMASKLRAAREAAKSGCMAVIANGLQKDIIQRVMRGEDTGTLVPIS